MTLAAKLEERDARAVLGHRFRHAVATLHPPRETGAGRRSSSASSTFDAYRDAERAIDFRPDDLGADSIARRAVGRAVSVLIGWLFAMRDNAGMARQRSRVLVVALGGMLALAVLATLVGGLRATGSAPGRAGDAQLLRPRFAATPALRLDVLVRGRLTGRLAVAWQRAGVGGKVDLARLRGQPVVLNFWASWCDPCRREAPLLQRAWRAQRGRVLFLGVNQNDATGDARAFLRRFAISYPSVREDGDATARRWGVRGFPVTFFLARDGDVVAEAIGQLRPAQLERGIRAARSGALGS